MSFGLVCLLTAVVTIPFGLAFLLLPESTAALYGIVGWNAGTIAVGRLFGTALLYIAGAVVAARHSSDVRLQRSMGAWLAPANGIAAAVALQAVAAGAVNALGYSTVALYGLFAIAWATVAIRRGV